MIKGEGDVDNDSGGGSRNFMVLVIEYIEIHGQGDN